LLRKKTTAEAKWMWTKKRKEQRRFSIRPQAPDRGALIRPDIVAKHRAGFKQILRQFHILNETHDRSIPFFTHQEA
jgi:hypothetical protein